VTIIWYKLTPQCKPYPYRCASIQEQLLLQSVQAELMRLSSEETTLEQVNCVTNSSKTLCWWGQKEKCNLICDQIWKMSVHEMIGTLMFSDLLAYYFKYFAYWQVD